MTGRASLRWERNGTGLLGWQGNYLLAVNINPMAGAYHWQVHDFSGTETEPPRGTCSTEAEARQAAQDAWSEWCKGRPPVEDVGEDDGEWLNG